MPVPIDTFFGLLPDGKGISYGDVHRAADDERIFFLECRLRNLLIKQIQELYKPEIGERKVYAPFPLAIMSCISIETLGEIFYHFNQKPQNYGFVEVVKKFDPNFSRKISKENKQKLQSRYPTEEVHLCENISELIYSYFRNTFIHAYKGRAVFLEESVSTWEWGDGFLIVNPNWFWKKFLDVFEGYFKELYNNKEATNALMKSALAYIDDLIK